MLNMFIANEKRYDKMPYRHVGKWGLKLPPISLGMWQNFSHTDNLENMENMCRTAFDNGIIHFDLANNYGNPYNGSAEENFGKILKRGLWHYRDEICISTKAGYDMWPALTELNTVHGNTLPLLLTSLLREWDWIMLIFFIIMFLIRKHRSRKLHLHWIMR